MEYGEQREIGAYCGFNGRADQPMSPQTERAARALRDEITPVGNIGNGLNECSQALESAHKRIGELEHRLAPILTPPPPSGAEGNSKQLVTSDFAQALAMLAARIRSLGSYVDSLTGRVDL